LFVSFTGLEDTEIRHMTRIILTRHGQTEWNQVERFRGRAEIPLNETGLIQAKATARKIAATWLPVAIYTSPMGRAVKTGEAIAEPFGLNVQPVDGLNDLDYGDWQGLSPAEVETRWPDALDTWYRTPHLAQIPCGESLASLAERTSAAVRSVIRQHPQETVVLVGHDSVNRAILLDALGLPLSRYWHLAQGTCAINVLETQNGDFTVISMNETCHLAVE
jgi:broad specificity phosphatase PhoE